MKITGVTKVIKMLQEMQKNIEEKIDDVDWDKSNADDLDERFNWAWDEVETALNAILEIQHI